MGDHLSEERVMATTTPSLDVKSLNTPDETRPFKANGRVEIVHVGGLVVGRGTFEPGWRWSEHVKPIAQTDSCQAAHAGYVLSGRMRIRMDDGTEGEIGPGDVMVAAPGHDAWVVGDEPCVLIDFGASVGQYARPS
jgi:quercetin dioxygenase-like cupin family protein